MNAIAERFVGTLRRDCLDWFVILSEAQLKNILTQFIRYYNTERPHQGINYQVPKGFAAQTEGDIISTPILGGLIHTYSRVRPTSAFLPA